MDESEFHEGLKERQDQDAEWAAAAEHFLRLKTQTKVPEQEQQEKTAYEIKPSDRTDIPKKDFAQPNKEEAGHEGKYPIPDRQHARSALGFAKMHHDSGALSAVKAKIEKKYPDMLGGEKTAGLPSLSKPTKDALRVGGAIMGSGAIGGSIGGAINAHAENKSKLKGALKGAAKGSLAVTPLSLLAAGTAHGVSSIANRMGYVHPSDVAKAIKKNKLPGTGRVIDPKYTVTSKKLKKYANALDTFKSFKDPRVAIPAAAGALLLGGLTFASSKPRPSLGGKSRAEDATAKLVKSQKGDDESKMGLGRKLARRTTELSHGIAEAFRSHPLKASAMGAASGALTGATIARMMGAAKGK